MMSIEDKIAGLHAHYNDTEAKIDAALQVVVKSRWTSVCTAAAVLFCLWLGWFVRGLV